MSGYGEMMIHESREKEYSTHTCPNCKGIVTVAAYIERGFSDHEILKCPNCNAEIREIRADMGYKILSFVPTK